MKYPDDIDFFYVLENHGWSICYIFVGGEMFEMGPTHVFNNPIEVLLNSLAILLNGEDAIDFLWHDEPGEYKWNIRRNPEQKHKVNVSITECVKIQCNIKPELQTLKFEVKLKLFCLCVLKQMEKIRELMTEKSYKEHRNGEFPYSAFKEFKLAYEKSNL
jgi:hypothetical protein